MKVINTTCHYFRWFRINKENINGEIINNSINDSIRNSLWIETFLNKVTLRHKALPELMSYLDSVEEEEDSVNSNYDEGRYAMIELFKEINYIINCENSLILNDEEQQFLQFTNVNFIDNNEQLKHLPIPVFLYIKPSLGIQFVHHILISMGKFSTQID